MQFITDIIEYLSTNGEAAFAALATLGAFAVGLVAVIRKRKRDKPNP